MFELQSRLTSSPSLTVSWRGSGVTISPAPEHSWTEGFSSLSYSSFIFITLSIFSFIFLFIFSLIYLLYSSFIVISLSTFYIYLLSITFKILFICYIYIWSYLSCIIICHLYSSSYKSHFIKSIHVWNTLLDHEFMFIFLYYNMITCNTGEEEDTSEPDI